MDKNIMRIAELCEQEEPKNVYTELKLSSIDQHVWIMDFDEDGKCSVKSHFTRCERESDKWYKGADLTPVTTADIIRELEAVRNA